MRHRHRRIAVRIIRARSDQYFVDVRVNGVWHPWNNYTPVTKQRARELRSFMLSDGRNV